MLQFQWYDFAIISAVLMSVATLTEKFALRREHAASFSASMMLITMFVSLLFLPWANSYVPSWQWFLLLFSGFLSSVGYLLTARLYRHAAIATTTSAFSALPILFVVSFAYVFLGEQLSTIQYAAMVVLILATYFLVDFKRDVANRRYIRKYQVFLSLDSFLMAAGAIILKYQLATINFYTYLVWNTLFSTIFMLIFMQYRYGGLKETFKDVKKYSRFLFPVSVLTVGYRITSYVAIALAPVALASPLRNVVFVVLTVVASGVLLHEKKMGRKFMLTLVILAASYFIIT